MTQSTNGAEFTEFPEIDESKIESGKSSDPAPTFEEEVNAATKGMTQNEDGTWKVPDNLSAEVAYAATLEKRRRDTQSAFAKNEQKLKAIAKERDSLRARVVKNANANLTVAQKEELEDLKGSDPDAWLAKKGEYEQSALTALNEELDGLSEDDAAIDETARRTELLQNYLDDNPGLVLDDNVFENDLPPRITSKLANGDSTFEEFLAEAVQFLKPKTVVKGANDKEDNEPNLGKTGGGSTADENSIAVDAEASYRTEIY